MYKLPKEVFEVILKASKDPDSGERRIGYLCGKRQEIYDDMEYVLQKFLPGEQGQAEEYWLYRMEEFNVGEEYIEFTPVWAGSEYAEEGESHAAPKAEEPERKKPEENEYEEKELETTVISSLSELLKKEPRLGKYVNLNKILN